MDTVLQPYLMGDLFCGAGGSSSGAELAVAETGRTMVLVCVNHWPVAIETHKKNHPTARHYVEDVTVADPNRIVPEGYLDLLMASPECLFYSRARGGRPVHDQGRMNPWAIHRWLTSLNVRCLLVENVPEFIGWGPLLPNGKPDPKGKGLFFQAWVKALWEMGYKAEWRFLNAADYGDATTRTRFFLIARNDGKPVTWPEPTHRSGQETEMMGNLPHWRAAREIIDWSNPGRSLLDDPHYLKRPLSEKTRLRIARGLEKFGGVLAPYYIQLLGLEAAANGGAATPEPFIMGKQANTTYRGVDEPVQTITTQDAPRIIDPVLKPFVMGKQGHSPAYRGVNEPIPTATAEGRSLLIEPIAKPFVIGQHSGSTPRSIDNPIPTVMSDGAISLTTPIMVKYYGHGDGSKSVEEPVPTLTTKDRIGLASPMLVDVNHGGHDVRQQSVDSPLGTVTTTRGKALVSPFISPYYGTDGKHKERAHSVEEPVRTISTRNRFGLVEPFVLKVNEDLVRSADDPIPTIVTKQNTGLVEAVAVPAEPGIDPLRLITIDGNPFMLDIRFRMLSNLELARAMGFTNEESTYEFVGNSGEVTRQIGNAVCVNMAKALVKAILRLI